MPGLRSISISLLRRATKWFRQKEVLLMTVSFVAGDWFDAHFWRWISSNDSLPKPNLLKDFFFPARLRRHFLCGWKWEQYTLFEKEGGRRGVIAETISARFPLARPPLIHARALDLIIVLRVSFERSLFTSQIHRPFCSGFPVFVYKTTIWKWILWYFFLSSKFYQFHNLPCHLIR